MQVTILGASGKVGRLLTAELLSQSYTVVAFVHANKSGFPDNPLLTIKCGDVHDAQDIEDAISGSSVVISALGSWGTKTKDILSSATAIVIPAMQARNITRLISVTGNVAMLPDEQWGYIARTSRTLLGLIAGPILRDAEKHLNLLSSSNLVWTAFRSPPMISGARKKYRLSQQPLSPIAIVNRQAVVTAMIDSLKNNTSLKQAPFIRN